jgi:hypothetical protein
LTQIAEYRSSENVSYEVDQANKDSRQILSQRGDDADASKRPQHLRSLSSEGIPSIGAIADMWDAAERDANINGSSNMSESHSHQIGMRSVVIDSLVDH